MFEQEKYLRRVRRSWHCGPALALLPTALPEQKGSPEQKQSADMLQSMGQDDDDDEVARVMEQQWFSYCRRRFSCFPRCFFPYRSHPCLRSCRGYAYGYSGYGMETGSCCVILCHAVRPALRRLNQIIFFAVFFF